MQSRVRLRRSQVGRIDAIAKPSQEAHISSCFSVLAGTPKVPEILSSSALVGSTASFASICLFSQFLGRISVLLALCYSL